MSWNSLSTRQVTPKLVARTFWSDCLALNGAISLSFSVNAVMSVEMLLVFEILNAIDWSLQNGLQPYFRSERNLSNSNNSVALMLTLSVNGARFRASS